MILERIQSPADVKSLSTRQLETLASEIRAFLVETTSRTGGHLGPNLGVVELTLALHRVFDSPRDRIIWDTGHQAYVHKILTGRRDAFDTLKQRGGLSGYPSRAESDHDLVENSHASTALSYAAGLAEGRRRTGEAGRVIAIVGDGALTGGMAYEALNNIGHEKPDVLIVLNDNGRSYQPTVGGVATHLARLRLSPGYHTLKHEVEDTLKRIPAVGGGIAGVARRVKQATKQLVAPQVMFEDLGLLYSGPIDGHDIVELERSLRLARGLKGPVVVHVLTQKGQGYGPAVADEVEQFHSPGPFEIESGRPSKAGATTYTEVYSDALCEIARRSPDVVAITAAMASPTGLDRFAREHPDRFFDVGIAEQHAVTFAAGLAMSGLRPVVALYSTFLQRALDQLLMDVCLHQLPVVVTLDRAGITGPDGPSHHGVFDLSFCRTMPGLTVMAPADESELRHLLWTAVSEIDGPCLIRFPRGAAVGVDLEEMRVIPSGMWDAEAEVVPGSVVIMGTGKMVAVGREAARLLEKEGVAATVINARYIKPLDGRLSQWAAQSGLVVTIEDNIVAGGFGAAVAEALISARVRTPQLILGVPDEFQAHARPDEIHAALGLDPDGVVRDVMAEIDSGRYTPVRRPAHGG